MFRLGDSAGGLQAAGVVEFPDGRWPAVEAKLGGAEAIDSAADSLLRLRRRVGAARLDQLAALMVVTAVGYGYTRPDGVRLHP